MSSDEESGGEHTNAEYYARFWTKKAKVRYEPKKVKPKWGRTESNRGLKSQSLAFLPTKPRPQSLRRR